MKNIHSIAFFILILAACQSSDLKKMTAIKGNLPDEVSRDVHLMYSDSGVLKFVLEAPLVHKYTTDTNYSEFPEGVLGQFFNEEGVQTSELTAGYALKVKQDDEIIFRKNVTIKNHKKETLISEELYLLNDTIYSDTVVYIKTPSLILEGIGLTATRDFSSYKLHNPTGVYYPEDKEMKNKFGE